MTGERDTSPAGARALGGRVWLRKGAWTALAAELRHHVPFTAFSAVAATAVVAALATSSLELVGRIAFPSMHFVHLFLSAVASAAVSWRHRPRVALTLLVGVVSSIVPCTLSDIVLPFVGGRLAGFRPTFELELLEQPVAVVGAALVGSAFGFVHLRRLSIYSHSLHVVMSTFASLGYLLTHASGPWLVWQTAPVVVVILFVSVFVPCCVSDFAMPVVFTHCDLRDPHHDHRH